MHFQYNTLLFGIFFYSLGLIFSEQFIAGAIVYTILLNMKHIFIYVVKYCFKLNFFKIGTGLFCILFKILRIQK
jgi:hypothetical protein